MTITCPNCGNDITFSDTGHEWQAVCDCGFEASIHDASIIEHERWEDDA